MWTKLDLAHVPSLPRGHVRFGEGDAVDRHLAVGDGDPFTRQPDDALDEHGLSADQVDRDDVPAGRRPAKVRQAREPEPGARLESRLHADAVGPHGADHVLRRQQQRQRDAQRTNQRRAQRTPDHKPLPGHRAMIASDPRRWLDRRARRWHRCVAGRALGGLQLMPAGAGVQRASDLLQLILAALAALCAACCMPLDMRPMRLAPMGLGTREVALIQKPFTPAELAQRVRQALDEPR